MPATQSSVPHRTTCSANSRSSTVATSSRSPARNVAFMERTANGALEAISCAYASASCRMFASSARRSTKPSSCACVPVSRRAVYSRSAAHCAETIRGKVTLSPNP